MPKFEVGQKNKTFVSGSPCEVVSYEGDGNWKVVFNKGSSMHKESERVIHERNLIASENSETLSNHLDFLLFGADY